MSDIVVQGKMVEKVDEILYESQTASSTVSIYKYKISDIVTGKSGTESYVYISYGGTELPNNLSIDEECVVYLKKNELKYNNHDVYCFVSITQGVFHQDNDWKNDNGTVLNSERIKERGQRKE